MTPNPPGTGGGGPDRNESRSRASAGRAAEADVAGRRVDGLGRPGGGTEPEAVVRCAQVGPALDDPAGLDLARGDGAGPAVDRRTAAGPGRLDLVAIGPPVRGPLPHVAGDVVQA